MTASRRERDKVRNRVTAKTILHAAAARRKLLAGVDALANVVKVTLGPSGRNVLLEASHGQPTVTKDGASVAKAVELPDRLANLGALMVREVAERTSELAGDGTTTATLLAQAIYREGVRLVAGGHDPIELKRGIHRAVACVVVELVTLAKPVAGRAELSRVGTMSANGDRDIGDLLAEAMERVGPDGVVSIEESQGTDTALDLLEGVQLERGYLSPYFVTDTRRAETKYEGAYVLVSERKLSTTWELVPLLELLAKAPKPLLIVADDVEGDALSTLVVNKLRGAVDCVAVKAPSFGDRRKEALGDIAALTGAKVISAELGLKLEDITLADLGRARRVTVDKSTTTIVGGAGSKERIDARVAALRAELARASSTQDEERLRQRLAKLSGGVAVLRVGGYTELAMKETKGRADDAWSAMRAAAREGVVPGGGVALIRAQKALDELDVVPAERAGVDIVRRALEKPLWQIAENAGADGDLVVARVRAGSADFGYDASSGELGALLARGVIDPVHVVRSALENAASVAVLMLTSECLIAAR